MMSTDRNRMRRNLLATVFAALLAPLFGATPLAAEVICCVVAYSGMPAPGASPAVFDNFNYPTIAPQGEIIFRGRLNSAPNTTYGLWRKRFDPVTMAPVLSLVQREGQPSPVAGFNFAGFPGPPTINLPGLFAFKAHIQSGATLNDTLWVEKPQPTGLALVAREGAPAPGVPGANFGAIFISGYDPLLLDDSGRALFAGSLTGGGVTAANDTGLWFYDGSATTLVAREGDQMPGVPAGHLYADRFLFSGLSILGSGAFVFFASDGDPVNPIQGLWSNHSGTVAPLILEDGSAPGLAAIEKLVQISSFRINNNNQVAFSGIVERDDGINPIFLFSAVWISNAQGVFQLAARSDQQPPVFRVPGVAYFTDAGHVIGVDGAGRLARVTTGGLTVIAKPDDAAPGTAAGVQFAAIQSSFASGNGIAANSGGQVAFKAALKGPGVNLTNDLGLWALDDKLQLVKVAREGDTIEAPAGMPRTITSIEFALSAASGGPRVMSERGDVLWKASVVGLPLGSQVLAVTGVGIPPEPDQCVE